jgi:hypothetical protein
VATPRFQNFFQTNIVIMTLFSFIILNTTHISTFTMNQHRPCEMARNHGPPVSKKQLKANLSTANAKILELEAQNAKFKADLQSRVLASWERMGLQANELVNLQEENAELSMRLKMKENSKEDLILELREKIEGLEVEVRRGIEEVKKCKEEVKAVRADTDETRLRRDIMRWEMKEKEKATAILRTRLATSQERMTKLWKANMELRMENESLKREVRNT